MPDPANSSHASRPIIQGQIGYFGDAGRDIGRETFQISQTSLHRRSLTALCELPESGVVRSCQLEVDAILEQAEAFVRVEEYGEWLGSARYAVGQGSTEATIFRPDAAAAHKRAKSGPSIFFGTHSLINDGWLPALATGELELEKSGTFSGLATCSLQADGGGAPDLLFSDGWFEPLGHRVVDVAAGRFACLGWRVGYGDYPPLDIWLTIADHVMVLMDWPENSCRYELLAVSGLS